MAFDLTQRAFENLRSEPQTFEQWLEEVDKLFVIYVGIDRDSWPDQDYWNMWDGGDSPRDAVVSAVENEYGAEGLAAFNLNVS